MSQTPVAIPKQPILRPAEDFYQLRREGIGFIEQMGSQRWTDYNLHDPGITILEALCYAITDLAYRTGWDIKDLLAPENPATDTHQPFFTARDILTVNPWTVNDFRRLLIDNQGVRNAWLFCKACACDFQYYAWCDEEGQLQLTYSKQKPEEEKRPYQKVNVQGLYEVLLELESDPTLGDLNDRKIERQFTLFDANNEGHLVIFELRFPAWELLNEADFDLFTDLNITLGIITIKKISRSKTANNFVTIDEIRRNWNGIFYVSFEMELPSGAAPILIENATLRIFGDTFVKNKLVSQDASIEPIYDISHYLQNSTDTGFIQLYRRKLNETKKKVEAAKSTLHAHRNLDEDYCRIQRVAVEDVAVCADVEVAPDADIERVQAQIWFAIERYFNPPVPFYSLQEMLAADVPTEAIFNGPALRNGFIKTEELEAAALKTELRTSDIINLLMDIPGVRAVNNLLLTKYDAEGNPVKGSADIPRKKSDPNPNPNKISAQWTLSVTELHQPRLYFNLSRFLFYKSGLPFQPRADEALDTLTQLRGEAERPKFPKALGEEENLPVPTGMYRNPTDYYPVQYSLPPTYGVGYEGIPQNPTLARQAKAKQLKAYLMVFEQLLLNATTQIANVAKLFSLDTAEDRTYFIGLIDDQLIRGAIDIVQGGYSLQPVGSETPDQVIERRSKFIGSLTETKAEFLERRNRFLDHLLARFGEQFGEYALLLTNLKGQAIARAQLIDNKLAFLKAYPVISRDRAKAFDYRSNPTHPNNLPGLHSRISRLLGFEPLSDNERFILVEHLLLQPKFPGDALYPACAEGGCGDCSDQDPYSFRLTFVMAGWSEPFNTNLEMRRFADRTIKQETPSHLLPKICWVGNDGFKEGLCNPAFTDIVALLEANNPSENCEDLDKLSRCADQILTKYETRFITWFEPFKTDILPRSFWKEQIQSLFLDISQTDFDCSASLDADTWLTVQERLLDYFTNIAFQGWQFERFEAAWQAWLEANKTFDWTEERLHERVEAILETNLDPNSKLPQSGELCKCATNILTTYGTTFYNWMKAEVDAGKSLKAIKEISVPEQTITLCAGLTFKAETDTKLKDLLQERYTAYREVSYRLWKLLQLLGNMSNTYPSATLHDCDDGSDENPVRLGSTALGGFKSKPRITPTENPRAMPTEEKPTKPVRKSRKTGEKKPPKNKK